MKPINEMNLSECLVAIRELENHEIRMGWHGQLADRIHELTRWIPVSERLPTEEDGDEHGHVLVSEVERESPNRRYEQVLHWDLVGEDYFYTATHWRRIDKP